MDWTQTFTIIVSLAGVMVWVVTRFDRDIDRIDVHMTEFRTQIQNSNNRLDATNARLDATNARLDALYTTMISLLNDSKKKEA